MGEKSNKSLQNWILDENRIRYECDIEKENCSNGEKEVIKNVVDAFSEYILAINSDYVYNKTYLSAFVEEFCESKLKLKNKYDILIHIINVMDDANINLTDIVIRIDRVWVSSSNEIELIKTFNLDIVKSKKTIYEIEYVGENGFVIANNMHSTNINDENLKSDIELFIKRYKEICSDGQ